MRPKTLDKVVGQTNAKNAIQLAIDASKKSGMMPHMLFAGKPGTGKTTLARAVAGERKTTCYDMVASAITSEVMLMNTIMNLEAGDVLFIDEIHDLPDKYAEILYTVMEDNKLSLALGYHMVNMPVPVFTLIGATNKSDDLPKPFQDRFGLILNLDDYTQDELADIAKLNATIPLHPDAAMKLAIVGRGIPRITARYVDRVMDYAFKHDLKEVSSEDVDEVLKILQVNQFGLTTMDMKILTAMMVVFSGKPAGIKAIAAAVGETSKIIEEQVEPFLLQRQYITRLPNGRVLTEYGLQVLKATKSLKMVVQ